MDHKISAISLGQRQSSARRMSLTDETVKYEDVVLEPLLSPQILHIGHYANDNSSIDKVRLILESEDAYIPRRPLFCEMLYYDLPRTDTTDPTQDFWKECCRWIKFEETVEEGGTRWSKPHITLLTIQSLLQIRSCLTKGTSLFDVEVETFQELVEMVCSGWNRKHVLSNIEMVILKDVLLTPKQHLVRNKLRVLGNVPYEDMLLVDANGDTVPKVEKPQRSPMTVQKMFSRKTTDEPPAMEEKKPTTKINQSLFRKIPEDSEAACIFVGFVPGLRHSITEFVRLKEAKLFADVTELPVPTRFVFILLLPIEHRNIDAILIGKCMGTLIVDDLFSNVAYRARNGPELACAVEEFLNSCVIVPAGKWNRTCRWEPPENQPVVARDLGTAVPSVPTIHRESEHGEELRRTGKIFGGLIEDVKLKAYWYKSDYIDAFHGRVTQTLAAAIFLFFANISKIITFGGVMDHVLHHKIGAIENVLAGGICGVIYALFAGQPLCVLSATGPCLVFEVILYDLCESWDWNFLAVRAWVGFWTAIFLMVLVCTDASVVVGLITRFTEEAFATLISLIFLVKAIHELLEITHEHPVTFNTTTVLNEQCICGFGENNNITLLDGMFNSTLSKFETEYTNYSGIECKEAKGKPIGAQCFFSPDVFMFSIILMVSTFVISLALKIFRHSSFFTSKVRNVVADFNAIIAICIMTAVNYFVGLDVPCLNVPEKLKPTTERSWFIDPFNINYWWITLVTILPAAFFSVLVMMDQNITSVIINRPDNKLKKGYGYHLDLTVIAFLMIVCSLMAIPFYVAATVISLMHVDSLRIMSQTAAPGEKPQFLGIREQRVTALVAHILIGLAVFLTPIMRLLPMPVLLGVFLYIGIVSLAGQQFVQRVLLLFMPMKHQPDYPWLRLVRMKRVHLFTIVQLISFLFLLIIEENKKISMVFPLMIAVRSEKEGRGEAMVMGHHYLVIMVLIRKVIMERIFTQKELCALDDPLPSWREMFRSKRASNKNRNMSPEREFNLEGNQNFHKNYEINEEILPLQKSE